MGRDEHQSKKNSRLAQTPKQQIKSTDGSDVEFSYELADDDDKKAMARMKAAEKRMKNK